ncbi:hypothetical protein ACE418_12640 [Megasphaera sp. WILCCON 0056]
MGGKITTLYNPVCKIAKNTIIKPFIAIYKGGKITTLQKNDKVVKSPP